MLFEFEHGHRAADDYTAGYWSGTLCSSARSVPLLAGTSAAFFGRTALELAPRSEVSIALGIGGARDETASLDWYSTGTRLVEGETPTIGF